MGDLQEPDITLTEEERLVQSPSSNPNPSPIGAERWAIAEKSTQKIICQVQPTVVSEKRRNQVIDYVRRLIRNCNGCEVFPYGSVPLKTYLPDGDIDLTAFGGAIIEEALANNIVSELQREEKSSCAEFLIKEIQLIHAEVKLVKCLVQNIVVDISFNQIGGLCTLCFLEQVDRFIGKDHLFKRSILLIKSWCYYESRILGAHHGLISTYALETLVLYIFQVFHSTLDGPLAVLYKFLDYFSKFDWENYCISLRGPVRVSSLPEIEVETPEKGLGDLLLSEDFYRYCVDTFSVPLKDADINIRIFPQKHLNIVDPLKEYNNLGRSVSKALYSCCSLENSAVYRYCVDTFSVPLKDADINIRIFPQKHLNIVDPLKEYNNLGRSVSKGNFYRIRSAFTYGARKLGQILMRPEDSISAELCTFFSNTLDRHGSGQRPDVQDPVYISTPSFTCPAFSVSETESTRVEKVGSSSKAAHFIGIDGDSKHNPVGLLQNGVYVITALEEEMKLETPNGQQKDSLNNLCSTVLSDANGSAKGGDVLGFYFSGAAEYHAIPRIQALKISDDSRGISNMSGDESDSSDAKFHYAPHLHFSKPPSGSGETKYGDSKIIRPENHDNRPSSEELQVPEEEKGVNIGYDLGSEFPVRSQNVPSVPYPVALSEGSHNINCGLTSASNAACPESLNSLLDLRADFKFHFNCLQYGRWFYEYPSYIPALSIPPLQPSHFQSMNSWDSIQRSSLRNGFSNGIINSVIQSPMFYPINPMIAPGLSFGSEEMPKPRGTGTYFPNMNRPPQGYRSSVVKGRNQAPVRSPRSNGGAYTFTEFPVDQGVRTPGFSDVHLSVSPWRKVHPSANGSILQPNGVAESGSFWHITQGTSLLESSRQPRPASSLPQTSSEGLPTSGIQSPKAVLGEDENRCTEPSSYHLKDEDDFPPLSN